MSLRRAPLLLAAFAAVYFYKHLFLGLVSFADDLYAYSYFSKTFFVNEVSSGRLPLWDPHLFTGMPYLANLNSAVFYPFNLLYLAMPFPSAVTFYLLSHLIIAGIGVYLWGRELQLSGYAAFAAGLIYMYSGVFATENIHLGYYAAMAWAPAAFLFAERWLKSRDFLHALGAGLVLSLTLLSGSPQFLWMTGFCLAIYLVVRLVEGGAMLSTRDALLLLAGLGLGFLTCAAQLLPAAEVLRYAARPFQAGYEFSGMFSSTIREFLSQPFTRVNHGWVGAIPLFLAVWGLVSFRRAGSWILFLLALLTAVMSWGPETLLFRLAHDLLPGFGLFRAWYRFVLYAVLFLSLLAGFGIESILKRSDRFWPIFSALFPLFFAIWGYCVCRQLGGSVLFMQWGLVWILLAAGISGLLINERIRPFIFQLALTFLLALDLSQGATALGGVHPLVDRSFYKFEKDGKWLSYLASRPGIHRVYLQSSGDVPSRDYPAGQDRWFPVSPNTGQLFQFENIDGYDVLMLRRYQELVRSVPSGMMFFLSNVEYAATTRDLSSLPAVRQVQKDGPVNIYQFMSTSPRYFILPEARFFKDGAGTLAAIKEPDFNPFRQALIEGDSLTGQGFPMTRYSVKPLKKSSTETVLSVSLDGFGWLIVGEPYAPGWKATVDGERTDIYPAYHLFRAVRLGPGDHEVRFRYSPGALYAGLWISGLTAVLICLIARRLKRSSA